MMLISRCLHLILTDIITPSCLHHLLLEFLGTALFLSASLSGVLMLPAAGLDQPTNQSAPFAAQSGLVPVLPECPLQVVLVFGLSVAMAAVCVGGGVHLNPAVTIAMALTLRLHLWRAVLYVIGQLLGGVASAALMLVLTGDVTPALNQVSLAPPWSPGSQSESRIFHDSRVCVQVSAGVWLHQAVVVEMLVTLQLVLVVMATTDVPLPAVVPPLLVGLAVSLGHLVAVSSTGCGMNPARSFGPAVIALDFTDHWVFWAGPGLGACLAALLNDLLLRPRWHRPGDWWAELKRLHVLSEKQQQVALSHLQ
ncbi:aquaporin-1 isoform X1 [Amphiprion ocellaris]|uniref:aquaporin-1 isoform X1 n=1 Tax=Amphiprion ocellaris TaxID=80972 RepID=UPI001649BF42|nr:aquaporin-1 isoform X1 [Amphiprion ocellaris]